MEAIIILKKVIKNNYNTNGNDIVKKNNKILRTYFIEEMFERDDKIIKTLLKDLNYSIIDRTIVTDKNKVDNRIVLSILIDKYSSDVMLMNLSQHLVRKEVHKFSNIKGSELKCVTIKFIKNNSNEGTRSFARYISELGYIPLFDV